MDILINIWNELDFEKRNFLWSYFLQQVDNDIKNLKLSPRYKQVLKTREDLINISAYVKLVSEQNEEIKGIGVNSKQQFYKSKLNSSKIIERSNEVEFKLLPEIEKRYTEFSAFKDFLYKVVKIKPVGLERDYTKDGYLIIKNKNHNTIRTYSYFISNYVNRNKRSLVKLNHLESFQYKEKYNFIDYKMGLNRKHDYNLNCYLVESEVKLPLKETLVPIAKGSLSMYLR